MTIFLPFAIKERKRIMINAKLEVQERTNKQGEPYKVLVIHAITREGELLQIHEIYIKENLSQIINYIFKERQ